MSFENFLLINLVLVLLLKDVGLGFYLKEPIENRKRYASNLQLFMAISGLAACIELYQNKYESGILMVGFVGVYWIIRKELLKEQK